MLLLNIIINIIQIFKGVNVRAFCVENYICWGTPDDYETYVYWQKFFDKCSGIITK